MNEEKERLYRMIFVFFWQSVYSTVVLYAFLKVLFKYLEPTTLEDTLKYGAIEVLLTSTVFIAFKYWFPTRIENPINETERFR